MHNIKINANRLWDSLMEMAQLGATKKGGVCRLALSDIDFQARQLFQSWCEVIGMTMRHDAMGNQFARLNGKDDQAKPIMIGSHLDSQPTGGKYDGALGVLAGLEVMRTLVDHGIELRHPIELVNWTNEEGARFAPAMIGSGVFAGVFPLEEAHAIQDQDGTSIKESLAAIGYLGDSMENPDYKASLELHIEQGPVLEKESRSIGIVSGVQGVRWYEVQVCGKPSHAGTTPMTMRHDPVKTAMELIQVCYALVGGDEAAKITIGTLQAEPGSINTVPEKVVFNIDLRHPNDATLSELDHQLQMLVQINQSEGITIDLNELWYSPPVQFHDTCIGAIAKANEHLGYAGRNMISGAGHDSVYLNRVMPTGMIFIPCKGGLSHNEAESIEKEQAAAGTNVLLHSILNLDELRK